jgi:anti-sigma factor RsiW
MGNGHERYDGLALDHVLGGLSGRAASEFRSHLASCGACRSRVDELRGIAAELGEIERDERSRARLQTEVARRDDAGQYDGEPTRRL